MPLALVLCLTGSALLQGFSLRELTGGEEESASSSSASDPADNDDLIQQARDFLKASEGTEEAKKEIRAKLDEALATVFSAMKLQQEIMDGVRQNLEIEKQGLALQERQEQSYAELRLREHSAYAAQDSLQEIQTVFTRELEGSSLSKASFEEYLNGVLDDQEALREGSGSLYRLLFESEYSLEVVRDTYAEADVLKNESIEEIGTKLNTLRTDCAKYVAVGGGLLVALDQYGEDIDSEVDKAGRFDMVRKGYLQLKERTVNSLTEKVKTSIADLNDFYQFAEEAGELTRLISEKGFQIAENNDQILALVRKVTAVTESAMQARKETDAELAQLLDEKEAMREKIVSEQKIIDFSA